MIMKTAVAVMTLLALTALAVAAAQQPQNTDRPGLPTKASVFIENSGKADAVPVSLEDVNVESRPLRVEVVGTTQVAFAASSGVAPGVARVRQQWEHRTLTIPSGADADAALATVGSEGWEAVGFQTSAQGASIVLLKRPRQ